MSRSTCYCAGFFVLELLLGLALITLAILLFPSQCRECVESLDPRHWSRGGWVGVNVGVIVALFAIRFRAELKAARRGIWASLGRSHGKGGRQRNDESDADYDARTKRDAEWRERAKKRLPFT